MRDRILLAAAIAAGSMLLATGCNVGGGQTGAGSMPGAGQQLSLIRPDTRRSPDPAEIFNQVLPYPSACSTGSGPCPTDFEVVFQGNVTNDIPPNEPLSAHEDAFCATTGSSNCSPSVTYNSSSNTTTLEWSGPTLYQNRASGKPGVHFGLMAARNYMTSIRALKASSMWTYASPAPLPQPIVSINTKQPSKSKKWKYAIVYVAGTTTEGSTGSDYQTWNEIAYVPSGADTSSAQPKFTFANYGSKTIYVTSSGIVLNQSVPTDPECVKIPDCKENIALLAKLQEVDYPPPGYSGSPFVKLQYPPAAILKPKGK